MRGLNPRALLLVYVLIALVPVSLLFGEEARGTATIRLLALGTGLAALALLFMQFVSSGRYAVLSGRAGIDRTMRFHQLAARLVLLLALLHPRFFLIPSSFEGLARVPARAAGMFTSPRLLSGVVALALLVVLVYLGVLRNRLPVRYELWRASHMLVAVVVGGAALHHTFSVGYFSSFGFLPVFWWALAAVAFGSLGYVYLVKPFRLLRNAYRVVSNEEIGHRIRELVLEPAAPGRRLEFDAGQFGWVLLGQPPLTLLDHPFSISSAPEALPQLRLLVKARGDFTGRLHALAPGARAYLDAPHGNFTLRGRSGKAIVLIAGGIGIAPVIGLLRHLRARRDARPIGLVYGARNPSQLVHAEEIREAAQELDLQPAFFVDEPPPGWTGGVGELTGDAIRQALRAAPAECLCFLCGPTPMMLSCRDFLRECGVPRGQIVFERFEYD
jgi:predicted ferric reductase